MLENVLKAVAKYDWTAIKKEYVEAPDERSRPTLEELAARIKCSASYLRQKAAQENWRVEAERFLQTVATKRQEKKSDSLAGELAQWDAHCYGLAQASLKLVYERLKYATEGSEPMTLDGLDKLTRALERIQKIGKQALGEEEDTSLKINIDFNNLTDEQLKRIQSGEDPRSVIS